jgi:radical SAM superfamily enzyme YgiQ (UPF0313 family)
MGRDGFPEIVRHRLRLERGRDDKQAPFTVALAYPSPYRVAMSSLGFLQIYKAIQAEAGMACERVMLPDGSGSGLIDEVPRSYESLRALGDFPVVALSVAYELELAGVVQLCEAAGIPALREARDERHPLVVAGGPLTFSNPLPLAAFADVVVMGEADVLAVEVLRRIRERWPVAGAGAAERKAALLEELARMAHVFVPALHGDALPEIAACDDALLPAWSSIRTPDTELSDMFLVETARGCSRGCTYCVMRRSTNGGMRLVPAEHLLELVPSDASRVGLVGAAVSDHPRIVDIVRALAERGAEVGLSSLRPDRLDDDFVAALRAAGYRTLTTAMDGASQRVRDILDRRTRARHLLDAAALAKKHGIHRMKLYLMLGVPGETDADVDECAALLREIAAVLPLAVGIAPFCSKRNTPLDGHPFAGIQLVDGRLERLRRAVRGQCEVRATSARWAWVEHALAQGGVPEGRAVHAAVLAGGRFADYRRAFEGQVARTVRRRLYLVRSEPASGRRTGRWLEPTEGVPPL